MPQWKSEIHSGSRPGHRPSIHRLHCSSCLAQCNSVQAREPGSSSWKKSLPQTTREQPSRETTKHSKREHIHRPGIAEQGARAERRPNTAAHSRRASQSQSTKPRDDHTQRAYRHATGHRRARLSVDSSTPSRPSQPAFIRNSLRAGPDMGGKSTDERQHGRGTQGAHTLHAVGALLYIGCAATSLQASQSSRAT